MLKKLSAPLKTKMVKVSYTPQTKIVQFSGDRDRLDALHAQLMLIKCCLNVKYMRT